MSYLLLLAIGLLLFCMVGFLFFFVYFTIFLFILPILYGGAVFAKSDEKLIATMIQLAKVKPGEKAVDLGSGDGSVIIALAKAGAEAHGYELNPFLVWLSRRQIKKRS